MNAKSVKGENTKDRVNGILDDKQFMLLTRTGALGKRLITSIDLGHFGRRFLMYNDLRRRRFDDARRRHRRFDAVNDDFR